MSNNDLNDLNRNMMNLCNVLVGTGEESDAARAMCATIDGRLELYQSHDIPAAEKGDPGYAMVYYENGDNFKLAMQTIAGMATQILDQKSYSGTPDRDQVRWKHTELFDFLHCLTQDAELAEQFHALFPGGSQTEQQQFLQKYLPGNYYKEQEAISALLDQGEDEALGTSVGQIMTTFEATYRFCC
jgi:hypothetical protein